MGSIDGNSFLYQRENHAAHLAALCDALHTGVDKRVVCGYQSGSHGCGFLYHLRCQVQGHQCAGVFGFALSEQETRIVPFFLQLWLQALVQIRHHFSYRCLLFHILLQRSSLFFIV